MEQNQAKSCAAPATPTLKALTNSLKSVLDWHSLGVNLDLSGPELATIERDYHGDNKRCKTEMLSRWLENTTRPSWEAVVQALRLMEADAVADTIQRKYITPTATPEDPAHAASVQHPMAMVGVGAVSSSNISGTVPLGESPLTSAMTTFPLPSPVIISHTSPSVVPPTSQLTAPPHQHTPGQTASLAQQPMAMVGVGAVSSSNTSSPVTGASAALLAKENLRKIKRKFATVLVLARTALQNKNISVPDLRLVLAASYIPSEENNDTREINPSRFICDVLGTAQSIGEAFEALMCQNLLGFKNYHLLRSIIDNYASEISAQLDEYEDELGGYVLVTNLQDYLDAELEQTEQAKPDPKLFDELSVKVKVNVTEKTMQYVSELWTSLGRRIGLPLSALPLHRVAKGCIEIVWLLPSHLTHFATLQVQENTNYFREENVLRVTIAGQCIYDQATDPSRERDPSEGNEGVLQASEPVHGEVLKKEDPENGGDPDAENVSVQQRIQQLIDDEPEDPEAIPEHEQRMKCSRVIRSNYSLLYSHLDTGRLLPKLPDKELINEALMKTVQSYQQRFAQNAILIQALLNMDRPSNGLLKFCDTLETTPGQEHVGKKLLQDYKRAVQHPSAVSVHRPLPGAATAVHSDLSGTSELFQQLQLQVMDMLDRFPNALAKLKQVLASVVMPLGEGKTAPLVDPLSYEGTHTVRELFRFMSRYWNSLSTDLLSLLLEDSGYNQAAARVAEFVELRGGKGQDMLCIRQLPTLAGGLNDLDVADLETVHNTPLSDLQSLHPAVFTRLPEHKVSPTRKTIRISVEVNKSLLYVADYDDITTALSGFFGVPKASLVYSGCCKAPLVLCWETSHELSAYFTSVLTGISGHRLLVESGVTGVAIGDRVYKCPTLKDVELFEDCQYGLVRQVPYLLLTGANVNVTRFDGWTALQQASFSGHQKVVELLLRAGASLDLQDEGGFFPLYFASREGYAGIVELLLQAGASVDLQTKDGWTALEQASIKGHQKVVELLLQAGASPDLQNKDGWTALKQASINGHQKVVELLLRAGANPDLQDKDGFFPLYSASQEGYAGVVELLLQAGASVDLQTKDGFSPLHNASQKGYVGIVELLLQAGAGVDLQTKTGATPLYIACESGHLPVVECLIAAKADVNHQRKDGVTALITASYYDHPSVVRALLQAGATVNTTDQSGWTALHFAADGGHEDVVELLLEENVDINLPDKDSQETALMVAARKGRVGIVRRLIQRGASTNITNKAGLTAFDIASTEGHTDVCQALLTQRPS